MDRIILSYDGYCAYLLIVDSASQRVWAFLTASKEPPVAILRAFMQKFCLSNGIMRTNQGGKLARSNEFRTAMLNQFDYVVKPTGGDSPSQNGGAEYTTIPSRSKFARCSTARVSRQNSGLRRCYTQSTYITDLFTWRLDERHSRVGMPANQMLHISKHWALRSASSGLVRDNASSTAMTLLAFFLGTPPPTTILSTSM
jgi:hypothetical protein